MGDIMVLGLETELKDPPVLKGFFPRAEVDKVRNAGGLLTANVYFYPECANHCLFCAYGDNREKIYTTDSKGHPRKRIQMRLEDYTLLFKDIASTGAKTLFVPGMGEPFLREEGKDFLKYIESANEQGLYVIVISSLNPEPSDELVAKLKSLDVSIIAKLESMKPENFNRIVNPQRPYRFVELKRSDESSYGHITAGIKKLMDAEFNIPDKNGQVRLGSGTVINNFNKDEAANILRFYRENNIWPYIQCVSPIERALEHPELYKGLDKLAIFEELLAIDQKEYGYTWDPHWRRVGFDFVYPTIIVEFGGEVRFNAFFRNFMGNVLDEDGHYIHGSFPAIAFSPLATWLRKIHFSIGGAEGCSPNDHTKCEKKRMSWEDKIPDEYLTMDQNMFCPFESICTQDEYLNK